MRKKKLVYPYKYDEKKRSLAEKYVKGRLYSFIFNGVIIPIIAIYAFIASGAALMIANYLSGLHVVAYVAIYALIFFAYIFVVRFPLSFYFSYVREHKYGLSRYTLKAWFADVFKGVALGYIFEAISFALIFYFLQYELWWLYTSIAYTLFTVIINYAFPIVIFPIFYKAKPYTDKLQIARLKKMAAKCGVSITTFLLANESTKSTKANAFFAGFGQTKRIVLFDTLTNNFTLAEVETVVAHELGHYVNRDVWRGMIIDIAKTFIMFYIISLAVKHPIQNIVLIPSIILIYMILDLISMPITNTYSRHREARADYFALHAAQKPEAQASAERRLCDMALDTEKHNPIVEFILYTHPSAYKRIRMTEEFGKTSLTHQRRIAMTSKRPRKKKK